MVRQEAHPVRDCRLKTALWILESGEGRGP